MGKRHEISVGEVGGNEEPEPRTVPGRDHKSGPQDQRNRAAAIAAEAEDVNEHLTRDLARVRAKFSMDAPPGEPWLKTAWMSEVPVEEYEAEFVDAVADCLGAGMSLQDALTWWDSGDLVAAEPEEELDGSSGDEEPALLVVPAVPRRPTGGHRVLVR